jgi:hypothetical protein
MHGGFADRFPDIDQFCEETRTNKPLAAEFMGAYKEMISVIEEGRLRFRHTEKDKVALRLQEARKVVVSMYQKTELDLKRKYKAAFKEVYEAKYPGRIAEMKMKIVTMPVRGVKRDIVCIPLEEDGWFDLEEKDIVGCKLDDIVDDGSAIVGANQMQNKFQAGAAKVTAIGAMSTENAVLQDCCSLGMLNLRSCSREARSVCRGWSRPPRTYLSSGARCKQPCLS